MHAFLKPALASLVILSCFGQANGRDPITVNDEEVLAKFNEKVMELARAGKCMKAAAIKKAIAKDRKCAITPLKPAAGRLDPEEIYEKVLPSIFIVGSVSRDEEGEYQEGRVATAWVLAADGILVTSRHVFDGTTDGEVFGAVDHKGRAFPVVEIIGVSVTADLAIFKIDAAGLTPLPLADKSAAVGSWISVFGHPGDKYYTFTQGTVSRYSQNKNEDGEKERWMSVTADYAYGASGSPVVNRCGAVVGVATMTENIEFPEGEPKADPGEKTLARGKHVKRTALRRRMDNESKPKVEEAPKPKDKPKAEEKPNREDKPKKEDKKGDAPKDEMPNNDGKGRDSRLQMVIKLAAPVDELRALLRDKE